MGFVYNLYTLQMYCAGLYHSLSHTAQCDTVQFTGIFFDQFTQLVDLGCYIEPSYCFSTDKYPCYMLLVLTQLSRVLDEILKVSNIASGTHCYMVIFNFTKKSKRINSLTTLSVVDCILNWAWGLVKIKIEISISSSSLWIKLRRFDCGDSGGKMGKYCVLLQDWIIYTSVISSRNWLEEKVNEKKIKAII